jgi:hypothetical protein
MTTIIFVAEKHGRIDVQVHHHVSPVAQHDDGDAAKTAGAGLCHGAAPTCDDFTAHAGKAEHQIKTVVASLFEIWSG